MNGFVAIYRWRMEPQHEAAFRAKWREATMQRRGDGAFGSLLGRAENGDLVAIALWPSEEARTAAFKAMPATDWPPAKRLTEDKLTILDDLWQVSPFR